MITLDLTGRTPIYEQICKGFGELIAKGVLKENDKLPGARTLAKDLGLNPNTVAKAYSRLELDGIIYSVAGKGCYVAKQHGGIEKKLLEQFELSTAAALDAGISVERLNEIIGNLSRKKDKNEGDMND